MNTTKKIASALISVFDKNGLEPIVKALHQNNVTIYSTGGTETFIKDLGIPVVAVEDITAFPEILGGRVKTLHPKIFGGILNRQDHAGDVEQMKEFNIPQIDLVIVDLYPFEKTAASGASEQDIIEKIDIGGISLIRAAAKNFKDTAIVPSVEQYAPFLNFYTENNGATTLENRKLLASRAFNVSSHYDSAIFNYFNQVFEEPVLKISEQNGNVLRYGENPHQKGALYEFDSQFTNKFKTIKGEASFNNMGDISGAARIAAAFGKEKAICIVKHGNPCGFAIKDTLLESYVEALKCDPVSAFGGVVAVNGTVDKDLAEKMNEIFLEVVFAAGFTEDAVKVFESKKRIKLFEQGTEYLELANDAIDFKRVDGGFVFQDADKVEEDEVRNSKLMSKRIATEQEVKDMEIAYKIASLTKSNCVVYVKNSAMVAVGMGMTSRVDASKAALRKAEDMGLDVTGAVLASEAFFPFRDSIDAAAEAGVKCVIEPGGSIRDEEIIEAANEYGMALYFSGIRHFLH